MLPRCLINTTGGPMNTPQINVTPLIDVLLVLLIIFMVVSPLKPSAFKARIPAEPDHTQLGQTNDHALVVVVNSDRTLRLNNQPSGTIGDEELSRSLTDVFAARVANGDVSESFADDPARPFSDRIE